MQYFQTYNFKLDVCEVSITYTNVMNVTGVMGQAGMIKCVCVKHYTFETTHTTR